MKLSHCIAGISILFNFVLVLFLISSTPVDDDFKKKSDESISRSEYEYLSPRIFIDNQNDLLINFKPLRSKLRDYTYRLDNKTGYYFEYLPTGNSIGINEKEEFVPASLLKTPLAMGALKGIELGELTPNMKLTVEQKHIDKAFGNLWKKGVGHTLTLNDALIQLIKYSDNTAQHVLFEHMTGREIDDIFDYLDIPKEANESNNPVVTPKNYSSILRCLYLSCFLEKKTSNMLLHLLSETEFHDQIPAGVPKNVKVAHKIGVSTSILGDGVYTDCGIIYAPKRPYILCIMTEGDEDRSRVIMQDLSKITYDYVSKVN